MDCFLSDSESSNEGEQEPLFTPVHIKNAIEKLMEQKEYCVSILANPQYEMRFYVLKSGQIVPREVHVRSFQVIHVIVGALNVILPSGTTTVRAGEIFQIPPNTAHELKNPSADFTRYISIYTPAAHAPGEL